MATLDYAGAEQIIARAKGAASVARRTAGLGADHPPGTYIEREATMATMTSKGRIEVGDKVRIAFDNPPDEWGVVEKIYRANEGYHRRALVRYYDGKSDILPIDRLEIVTDTSILPEQYR